MYAAFGGSPTVGTNPFQQIPGQVASGTFNGPAGGAMTGDRGGLAMPGNFLPPASTWGQQADPNAGAWSNPNATASFGAGTAPTGPAQSVNPMGVPSSGFGGMTPPPAAAGGGMMQAAVMPGGGQAMGGSGGGWAGPSMNPFYGQMANDIGRRTSDMLGKSLANIQSNFVGSGGLGGSRQGIAQGQAIGDAVDSYQGNLANLGGSMWNDDQNRALQYRGQDIGREANQMGFYSNQRQQDMQGQDLGFRMLTGGLQTPWIPSNNANNIYGNFTGFGNSSNTSNQGGGWQGGLGGGIAGLSLARQMGWI